VHQIVHVRSVRPKPIRVAVRQLSLLEGPALIVGVAGEHGRARLTLADEATHSVAASEQLNFSLCVDNRLSPRLHKSLERRLERIKHFRDLQLEHLKCLYNVGFVLGEHYRQAKVVLHLHGVRHEDWYAMRRLRWYMRKRVKSDTAWSGANFDRVPMFIRIGEVTYNSKPMIVVVRLKLLNQCNLSSAKSSELGRHPCVECLWCVANRKLQILIDRLAARFSKCTDEIVQCSNKMLHDLTDDDGEVIEWVGQTILELMRVRARTLCGNDTRLSFSEGLNLTFEIEQASFALADSPLGIIE